MAYTKTPKQYDLSTQPRTIAEAKEQGSKTYWSGKPCKHGHHAPRWTSSSTCVVCHKQKNNSQQAKATRQKRFSENPETKEQALKTNREWSRKQKETNPEWWQEKLAKSRASQATPEGREYNRLRQQRNRQDPIKGGNLRDYKNNYEKRRNQEDPEHYLRNRMRNMHRRMMNLGGTKTHPSMVHTGCSPDELRQHLESQWMPGMSWDNKGEWEIDHIRPLASYDLTDPEQYAKAAHYTNLQPLWKEDNRRKSDKWHRLSS
jgi:hypothetical protein